MGIIKIGTKVDFDKFVNDSRISVIDFHADWCGPCKMMDPIMKDIAESITDVSFGKVDVDNVEQVPSDYQIMSIPTFILFKDGKEIKRKTGFMPKNEVLEFIKI